MPIIWSQTRGYPVVAASNLLSRALPRKPRPKTIQKSSLLKLVLRESNLEPRHPQS